MGYPQSNTTDHRRQCGTLRAVGIRLCAVAMAAVAAAATIAPAARAGSIRVPLDRDHPGFGRITVRYAVVRHTDRSQPPLEPVVAFEGGPGYGSTGSASTYLFMLGKLHRRHDLIVMDQRGTGSSGAIDCPALQAGIPPYSAAAAACARRLGRTAGAYGTAAVADDMAAVLRKLHVPEVDVYGDSYGTYAAQVFAVRHPNRTRAVVLDAAFDNAFDPFERESSAALRSAWRAICHRAGRCPRILGTIRALAHRLAQHPIAGTGTDADGVRRRVHLGPVELGELVYDATYTYTVFRDLPGAMAAVRPPRDAPACDPRPLAGGVCAVPKPRVAPHRRRARAGAWLPRLATAPDRAAAVSRRWVAAGDARAGAGRRARPVDAGRRRPARRVRLPQRNAGRGAEHRPRHRALRLPALRLARRPPLSTHARDRFDRVRGRDAADCRRAVPPHARAGAPGGRREIRAAGAAGRLGRGPDGRRRTRALVQPMYTTRGHGLRGGAYTITGGYLSHSPLWIRFDGARLVSDLAVSGRAVWDRRTGRMSARLRLRGAASGVLHVSFRTDAAGALATIWGRIGPRGVRLVTEAPWAPQG